MDYISEAERMKLYYKGFSEAGNADQLASLYPDVLSDVDNPDSSPALRDGSIFLFQTFYPLYHKLSYVNNNRFIHEDITLFEPTPQRVYTAEELYTTLQSLAPYAVPELIRTIGCSSATMTLLQKAFAEYDIDAFARAIDNKDCDLSLVSTICEYIWPVNIHRVNPSEEDIVTALDVVASILHDEEHSISQSATGLGEAVEPYLDSGDEETYLQRLNLYNRDAFDYLCSFYTDNYDRFKPKERKQIEPIILNGGGSIDSEFNLPDDYFSIRNESGHFEEFFGLHPDVVKAGSGQFELLVNTLSQLGYIDSTIAVKRLFAYRFSGCMRPAKVAPIEWHGKNGNSYELIYLVRNMTERANYRKMKSFFTGPKWVANRDSSYARGADYHLKETLHELYPTLPDQL
mgnify:CR=1 FL=1